ncbi:putative ribonuclease H-like domain-containing protein [Tanacetum coccineum]
MVPRAVLMKSGLVSINTARQNISKIAVSVNTARQVNTAHSTTIVNAARPMSYLFKTTHTTVKKPINNNTTFKKCNINQRVNTVRGKNVNTARPKEVVNVVQGNNVNAIKASACWVWKLNTKVLDHVSIDQVFYTTTHAQVNRGAKRGLAILNGDLQDKGSTKASDNAGQARKEIEPVKDYILLPLWTVDPPFSQDLKSSHNDGSKPSSDDGKKVDEDLRKDNISIFEFSRGGEDDDAETGMNNLDTIIQVSPNPTIRIHKDHPLDQVIHALKDPSWIEAMQEELLQFKLQEVWTLVDLPNRKRAIGTKWVFRNKKDERGIMIRNKARLVAQGYTQEKGIDYDEVFTTIVRIKAIKVFLAYASFNDFMVYQMDVKSIFLFETIEEEVYVCQPPRFEDPKFPDRVYKVEKALYGLHQAPRAWYKTLSTYLLDNEFQRGKIDKTLFIKRFVGDFTQVYVDDIIFGSTKKEMCNAFENLMHEKFKMSSIGELTFFLGLQVQQKKDGIFISQDKYVGQILKKFRFIEVKTASTPMETQKPLLKDEDGEEVDVHMYRSMIGSLMYLTSSRPDIMFAVCACARYQVNLKVSHLYVVKRIFSDYARASLDRKSTTGGCQFLRSRLISWQCKK